MTAFSYLELVCKYPRAAGAALYTHKAFGIHFVTFLVASPLFHGEYDRLLEDFNATREEFARAEGFGDVIDPAGGKGVAAAAAALSATPVVTSAAAPPTWLRPMKSAAGRETAIRASRRSKKRCSSGRA